MRLAAEPQRSLLMHWPKYFVCVCVCAFLFVLMSKHVLERGRKEMFFFVCFFVTTCVRKVKLVYVSCPVCVFVCVHC